MSGEESGAKKRKRVRPQTYTFMVRNVKTVSEEGGPMVVFNAIDEGHAKVIAAAAYDHDLWEKIDFEELEFVKIPSDCPVLFTDLYH